MMAEKARLFGDYEIAERILATRSPREQKKLGKQVRGFVDSTWAATRCDIVYRGNVAKFGQDSELQQLLKETGNRELVEASPYDRIWGIGRAANDKLAWRRSKWRGLNLLGKVLMQVRARFMSD